MLGKTEMGIGTGVWSIKLAAGLGYVVDEGKGIIKDIYSSTHGVRRELRLTRRGETIMAVGIGPGSTYRYGYDEAFSTRIDEPILLTPNMAIQVTDFYDLEMPPAKDADELLKEATRLIASHLGGDWSVGTDEWRQSAARYAQDYQRYVEDKQPEPNYEGAGYDE